MAQAQQTDPFEMWREWVTTSERQWNAFLNNAMATDEYSQSMGRFMDVYLNLQKNMNEAMGRYFSVLNVPTRNDVMALGERLSGIEERLSGIETAIASLLRSDAPAAEKSEAAATPRPPRTKKPPVH